MEESRIFDPAPQAGVHWASTQAPQELSKFTIRERALHIDSCISVIHQAIHPFIGMKRPEGQYEEMVPKQIPEGLYAARKLLTILESMSSD